MGGPAQGEKNWILEGTEKGKRFAGCFGNRFRSCDLGVMGPARFLCAIPKARFPSCDVLRACPRVTEG